MMFSADIGKSLDSSCEKILANSMAKTNAIQCNDILVCLPTVINKKQMKHFNVRSEILLERVH